MKKEKILNEVVMWKHIRMGSNLQHMFYNYWMIYCEKLERMKGFIKEIFELKKTEIY